MPLDLTRPLQTRDGHEVRIYATDGQGLYLIHGAVNMNGQWFVFSWGKEGRYFTDKEMPCDLVNAPAPKHKLTTYLNIHDGGRHGVYAIAYESKEQASNYMVGSDARVACIPITVEYSDFEGIEIPVRKPFTHA